MEENWYITAWWVSTPPRQHMRMLVLGSIPMNKRRWRNNEICCCVRIYWASASCKFLHVKDVHSIEIKDNDNIDVSPSGGGSTPTGTCPDTYWFYLFLSTKQ
jgi:hypothetical protein